MARRRHHYRRRSGDPPELNVTAFLNLMVVLVPFLLITAVFSRITILQLNLPQGAAGDAPDQPEFEVEVIVREQALEIGDGQKVIHRIGNKEGEGHDFQGLSEVLLAIKKNYPDKREATVLLEPQINYETVVAVMDATRQAEVAQLGGVERVELFPQVSIGDAPGSGQG
ncbi:MAG: biopolymer transporter ExbD [Halofilum sp. (in: g-proteobacteria)]|nr:biopolymer transporter ExbD [Halofilum sp. (in: g-proteobacteria)]